jgi:hypothetical protein
MFLFPRARAIEKELLKEKKDQSDKVYRKEGHHIFYSEI